MEDTAEQVPPAPPPPARPGRLERSRRERLLGGVCGGIAEHTGLDPTIVRLIALCTVLLGGAGLVVYAIAWAIVPEAAPRPDDPSPRWPILDRLSPAVLIAAGVITAFVVFDDGRPHVPVFPLLLLGIGAFLIWGHRRDDHAASAPDVTTAPQPAAAPAPDPAPPPVLDPGARAQRFAIGMGAFIAAIGVIALAVALSDEVSPRLVAGGALISVGAAMALSWRSRTGRALAPAALALFAAVALWSAIDVPFVGGIGERTEPIVRADQLPATERLAVGELTVDLRDIEGLRPGRIYELEASVGVGHLVVLVPDDVSLIVDTHAGGGQIEMGGEDADGTNVDLDRAYHVDGAPTLELDVAVGFGHLEVRGVP